MPVPSLGGRILLIDDEQIVRELVVIALSTVGYHVDALASAQEALELLNSSDYHLLLVDIKMPGMDGKQFFRVLTASAPELASRVVFITGDTVREDTREFLEMARRPVLAKPFDLKDLERLVAEQLGEEAA